MRTSTIGTALLVLLILAGCSSTSQTPELFFEPLPDDLVVYTSADLDSGPEMIGGLMAMYANLRYPDQARRSGIEGRVLVKVVVDPAGEIRWMGIERSSGNDALDKAAKTAFYQVEYNPGILNGEPVYGELIQPVIFRLGSM
ncbi:MAG: energy transducer TonB [Balneolia bacterium]|nr:energy transducer TonB [Balneolia bacterium]